MSDNANDDEARKVKNEMLLLEDIHFSDDDLSDKAKMQFNFHSNILKAHQYLCFRVFANERLTRGGKHMVCATVAHRYNNVKQVLNYLASNTPSVTTSRKFSETPIIIICGMPRAGTTLLHNLMACDPNSRAPLQTDMSMSPIPPILRSNIEEHRRRKHAYQTFRKEMLEIASCTDAKRINSAASHAEYEFEEDIQLLAEAGVDYAYGLLTCEDDEVFQWLDDTANKDFAYDYHSTVLQMLHNIDPPSSHWVLKSPVHTFWIDPLLKHYPHASFIMSHRRLDEVFPSSCRLVIAWNNIYFDKDDSLSLQTIVKHNLHHLDMCLERLMEYRNQQPPPQNVFDIQYVDLLEHPIETVRRIYDHFNFLQWSTEFEQGMCQWLHDNPQGSQGRHSYSLDQFGLKAADIEERYQEYTQTFL